MKGKCFNTATTKRQSTGLNGAGNRLCLDDGRKDDHRRMTLCFFPLRFALSARGDYFIPPDGLSVLPSSLESRYIRLHLSFTEA